MLENTNDCVFCKILSGEFSANFVYKDEYCVAFMDIQPVNLGHVLIVPLKHFSSFEDVPDDILARMMVTAKHISKALRKTTLKCQGSNLFLANGKEAGQEVFHAHLHVFPRFSGDGFGFSYGAEYTNKPSGEVLASAAKEISEALKVI